MEKTFCENVKFFLEGRLEKKEQLKLLKFKVKIILNVVLFEGLGVCYILK